ncbi:MAG: hypothetical protein ACK4ZJ_19525, partial [Allorhizobium sp.]
MFTSPTTVRVVARSTQHPAAPEDAAFVRAVMPLSGWELEQVQGEDGRPCTRALNVTGLDPAGSLPTSIVRAVATERALVVARVRDMVLKAPPLAVAYKGGRLLPVTPPASPPGRAGAAPDSAAAAAAAAAAGVIGAANSAQEWRQALATAALSLPRGSEVWLAAWVALQDQRAA